MDPMEITGLLVGCAAIAYQFVYFARKAEDRAFDRYDGDYEPTLVETYHPDPSVPASPTQTTVRMRAYRGNRMAS